MSTETRWRQRYANFQKALLQLDEAVGLEEYSNLERQGLIQCFEYTIELAWLTLKDILQAEGYEDVKGPRSVIKQAFKDNYIYDDAGWLQMWEARCKTSHTYDEEEAIAIALEIKEQYYPLLNELDKRLATEGDTV